MAAPLASSDDVADLWRPLSVAETAKANILIAQASALLRRAVSGLDTLVSSGAVDATLVTMVVTNAVLRVMQNPAGVTQQTAGPEAASWTGARAAGKVVITADEIATILPVSTVPTVDGAFVGTAWVRNPLMNPRVLAGEGAPGMVGGSPYAEVPPTERWY